MLRLSKLAAACARRAVHAQPTKAAGDISSVFPSLSGIAQVPLPARLADVQRLIVRGREQELADSWTRLLASLQDEIAQIKRQGSAVIPTLDFNRDVETDDKTGQVKFASQSIVQDIKTRGVVVLKNVIPPDVARSFKVDAETYINANPQVIGFPKHSPSVYELYWSRSQVRARSHANLIKAQAAIMSLWHSSQPSAKLTTRHPLSYADRLRIRLPGDAQFTLGPHIDGGSIERWEDPEYVRVYASILRDAAWEKYDPFDYAHRVNAKTDMYNGSGACSMFRMFQGWVAMSSTGPCQGTLKVYPLLKHATAYTLLRPFFDPVDGANFVAPSNSFPNTALGAGQELNHLTHPHLNLPEAMTAVPHVEPGDYVLWHCDTIHSVERHHHGQSDSSVLYIPAVPMTLPNLRYLKRQRDAFNLLSPPPDFPDAGGVGEREFKGAATAADFANDYGARAAGHHNIKWDHTLAQDQIEKELLQSANQILF
ncbi:hypothetical protein V1514DRAFT_333103 [Lipomyces japonicus]|uniref:uncharacterized protein n=1 Tax=Lipomyces japonicus TaxID=56871 RepID=UPI0034CD6EAF